MTWETMEREVRRDIEGSQVCRVFLDRLVPQESREPQESLDQAAKGVPQDQSGLREKKATLDSLGPWDRLELGVSAEISDLRALMERTAPLVCPDLQGPQ